MPGPSLQDAQQIASNAGLRTQYGLILPPGARVAAYVRSTGVQSGDDAFLATNLVTTLAAGLARARSGMGDFVVCLPGHSESVLDGTTFSSALLAGTKIIGVGRGSNMPTFTFSALASCFAVNKADVMLAGLKFIVNAIPVASVVTITAADCAFYNNELAVGVFGLGQATAVITVSNGADRADISGNIFRGNAGVTASDGILVTGVVDSIRITDNEMNFAATSTSGLIRIANVATNFRIQRNTIANTAALSVAGISFGAFASFGVTSYNTIQVQSGGAVTPGTTGITTGATMTGGFYQNFVSNDPRTSGIILPAVDT